MTRNYTNDYERLTQQVRTKAHVWRSVTPASRDYLRALDSIKQELIRLNLASGGSDARVKAALDLLGKLPADTRKAVKALPDVIAALDAPAEGSDFQPAHKKASVKALGFKSPWSE